MGCLNYKLEAFHVNRIATTEQAKNVCQASQNEKDFRCYAFGWTSLLAQAEMTHSFQSITPCD